MLHFHFFRPFAAIDSGISTCKPEASDSLKYPEPPEEASKIGKYIYIYISFMHHSGADSQLQKPNTKTL